MNYMAENVEKNQEQLDENHLIAIRKENNTKTIQPDKINVIFLLIDITMLLSYNIFKSYPLRSIRSMYSLHNGIFPSPNTSSIY